MRLEVPDDIVHRAETNATEMCIAMALQLYADNRIDHDDACRLSGISSDQFNRELLLRAMCVQQYPRRAARRRAV